MSEAAGPALQQECKAIGKVNTGDIAVTSGGNLKCKHVFHTSCAPWNKQSGEQVQNQFDFEGHKYAVFVSSSREKLLWLETQTFNRVTTDGVQKVLGH